MVVLLTGFICFSVILGIHFLYWRIWQPEATLRTLSFMFLGGLAACAVVLAFIDPEVSVCRLVYVACLYGTLALSYLITYTAVDSDSPTLSLIVKFHRKADRLLSESELREFIRAHPFVRSRIDQLLRDGLVTKAGDGRLRLTGSSLALLDVFDAYRRLIGRTNSGG